MEKKFSIYRKVLSLICTIPLAIVEVYALYSAVNSYLFYRDGEELFSLLVSFFCLIYLILSINDMLYISINKYRKFINRIKTNRNIWCSIELFILLIGCMSELIPMNLFYDEWLYYELDGDTASWIMAFLFCLQIVNCIFIIFTTIKFFGKNNTKSDSNSTDNVVSLEKKYSEYDYYINNVKSNPNAPNKSSINSHKADNAVLLKKEAPEKITNDNNQN